MSGKSLEHKREPANDSQFAEADSSTNSNSSNAEAATRQSSLQRIQLRKERVRE